MTRLAVPSSQSGLKPVRRLGTALVRPCGLHGFKKVSVVLAAIGVPLTGIDAKEVRELADDAYIVHCFLEQSQLVEGEYQRPPNERALLLGVQFEADAPQYAPISRVHDPNNLIGASHFDRIGELQIEQGRILVFGANHGDGNWTFLTLVLDHGDEADFSASVGGRSADGASNSDPFYVGRCQIIRPLSGSNKGFEALTRQEPTLELRAR